MSRSERGAATPAIFIGGTIGVLVVAFLIAVLLPVTDSASGAQGGGTARQYSAEALAGRKIYVREGCFTCHTQMVRDTDTDRYDGPAISLPGDYANEAPNLMGLDRIGPDLTCAGNRQTDVAQVVALLRKPTIQSGSTMPSYAYLTEKELNALAAYIVALHCGGTTS